MTNCNNSCSNGSCCIPAKGCDCGPMRCANIKVINHLESDSANNALSAAMGKKLRLMIEQLSTQMVDRFKSGITDIAVGHLPVGYRLTGKTVIQVLTDMLIGDNPGPGPDPVDPGVFGSFTSNLPSTTLNVGDPIPSGTVFSWTRSGDYMPGSTKLTINGEVIVEGADALSHTLTYSIPGKTTAGTYVCKVEAKQNDGTTYSRQFNITFTAPSVTYKVYYGSSELTALTTLPSTFTLRSVTALAGTYQLPALNYKYLVIEKALGLPNTIKDANTGFEIPFIDPVTDTFNGTEYYVLRSVNKVTGALTAILT